MKARNFVLCALFSTTLLGCTSQPHKALSPIEKTDKITQILAQRTGKNKMIIITVPAADNSISNQMVAVSLRAGIESNAMKDLIYLLKQPSGVSVAVISDNDNVAAATIEGALKNLNGFHSVTQLYFLGDKRYAADLKVLADSVGVHFEAIEYP